MMKVRRFVQDCPCPSADGNKTVVYIVKSQVDGHYIFYSEGELHGHQFRIADLMGESPRNTES